MALEYRRGEPSSESVRQRGAHYRLHDGRAQQEQTLASAGADAAAVERVRVLTDAQWAVLEAREQLRPLWFCAVSSACWTKTPLLAAAKETWMLSREIWRQAPWASSCGRESFCARAPTAAATACVATEPLCQQTDAAEEVMRHGCCGPPDGGNEHA